MSRSRFITEPSYAIAENLVFGRLAFNGMNPEIEKMMEDKRLREEEATQVRNEKEVQDEEMASYYGSVSNTINRKFKASKRKLDPPGGQQQQETSAEYGSDLIQQGHKMIEELRAQSGSSQEQSKWGENPLYKAGKKRKFMKPKD